MSIVQNFKYSLASKIVVIFLGVVLNLLIIRFFSVNELGIYSLILSVVNLTGTLAYVGTGNALQFFISEKIRKKSEVKKYFGTGFSIIFLVTVILSLLVFLLKDALSSIYKIPSVFFVLSSLFVLIRALFGVLVIVLTGSNKVKELSVINASHTLLRFSVIVFVLLGFGSLGALIAESFSSLVFVIGGFFIVREIFSLHFELNAFKEIFLYAVRIFGAVFINLIISPIYEFVLGSISITRLALYSAPLKMSSVFLLIGQSAYTVLFPAFVSKRNDKQRIGFYINIIFRFAVIFYTFCLFNMIIFSEKILFMVSGNKYTSSSLVLIIQSFAMVLEFFSTILLMQFETSKKPVFATYSVVWRALVTFVSVFTLIPLFFETGAALALLSSVSIGNIVTFYFSRKIVRWNFPWNVFFKCVLSAFLSSLIVVFVSGLFSNVFVSTFVGGIFSLISYSGLVYLLRTFRKEDVEFLRELIPARLNIF